MILKKKLTSTEKEILTTLYSSERRGNWKGFDADDIRMLNTKGTNFVDKLLYKNLIVYKPNYKTYKITPLGISALAQVQKMGYYY